MLGNTDIDGQVSQIELTEKLIEDADILLVEVLKEGDLEKIVEFTIFNPMEAKIDKIGIENIWKTLHSLHIYP